MIKFIVWIGGLLFWITLSFFVAPITTSIILVLGLLWTLAWAIYFLVMIARNGNKAWQEVKAEDRSWDSLLSEKWDTEITMKLMAARDAGWNPNCARIVFCKDKEQSNFAALNKIQKLPLP